MRGYIIVPDVRLEDIERELPNHIRLTLQEAGCLAFDVAQDSENPTRFSVYEEFSSAAAFERHQERVRNSRWGLITKEAERHYTVEGLAE